MLIEWKEDRLLFGQDGNTTLVIMPGINYVKISDWKKLAPKFALQLKEKLIELLECKIEKDEVKESIPINKIKKSSLENYISKMNSLETLDYFLDNLEGDLRGKLHDRKALIQNYKGEE